MKPKLILPCDDYGMHKLINLGALKAFKNGVLSGVSFVANGDAFENGVDLLNEMKNVDVGLHFNIIEGKPVAEKSQVYSLMNDKGLFYDSYSKFAYKFATGYIKIEHIKNELISQINKLNKNNIKINYFDSHRHLHLLPPIAKAIIPLLKKNNINAVRQVNTPKYSKNWMNLKKVLASLIMKNANKSFRENGFYMPDYFLGFFESGNINKSIFTEWLSKMNLNCIYEVGCHLGIDDKKIEEFLNWKTKNNYHASWETELNTVTDDFIKRNILETIQLISFSDLYSNKN